jgi:hypothetical protein
LELSTDGSLSGSLSGTGPMCVFAFPFPRKYQLSAYWRLPDEKNVTVEFFVDSIKRPFSACDEGIECMFWHTHPFVLKISGANDPAFSIDLNYQTDLKKHSSNPCYFGPIPNTPRNIPELTYKCEDEQEKRFGQFRMIFIVALIVLIAAIGLHTIGVVNLRVHLGIHEDETPIFKKVKASLVKQEPTPADPVSMEPFQDTHYNV